MLRADNISRDSLGCVSLRLGYTQTIPGYTSALSAAEPNRNIDSIYVGVLQSGPDSLSVKRCIGVTHTTGNGGSVYINGGRRDDSVLGQGDIAFGSYQGHIFWSRSRNNGVSRKRKNDGTSGGDDGGGTTNWGIRAPTHTPNVNSSDPDGATFSTCDGGEAPPWEALEGTVGFTEGNDGGAEGAILLTADATTGRATATRIFGGPQNYEQYDGGDAGIDEDLIEGYIKCSNPENLGGMTLMFDCNEDSAAPFQDDYYYYEFTPDNFTAYKPSKDQLFTVNAAADAGAGISDFVIDRHVTINKFAENDQVEQPKFTPRKDADWARFAVPRRAFVRNGGTADCGWNTLTAVRVVATSTQADLPFGDLAVDNLTISGGRNHPWTGTYAFRVQYEGVFPNYVALSPASEPSDPVSFKANGVSISINVNDADFQVTHVSVYAFGGALNQWYRFGREEIAGNNMNIDVNMREVEAAIQNITLNLNLATPPDDIFSIAGPYYDRLLVLTPEGLHLSQQLNPDTFSVDEVIKIGDGGEVPRWVVIDASGRVLVGTSADIWEIAGTFTRTPDGQIDAIKRPLRVPGANDRCVAVEGGFVAYSASDGPRLLLGGTSKLITGNLDLLLRGYTRYGVPGMNLGLAPGRIRMAIKDRFLYMLAPESGYETATPIVYRYDLNEGKWWRRIYPMALRSIYHDPANQLFAGDAAGNLWWLENGTTDNGAAIPVNLWTISDGLGNPLIKKDFHDLITNIDTGGGSATLDYHADQSATPTLTTVAVSTETAPIHQLDASPLNGAKRIQLRLSGSFTAFKFYDMALNFRERPMPRVRWDTGYTPLANTVGRELVWFRSMAVTVNSPVDLEAQIYFSGVLNQTIPIPIVANSKQNITDVFWLPIGLECKGRQPLIVLVPSTPGQEETAFEAYKLDFKLRSSGTATEMQSIPFQPEM